MRCDDSQARMIDVLYGEEMDPRSSFEFFQHLNECATCHGEYDELIRTRERLGEWEVDYPDEMVSKPLAGGPLNTFRRVPWWTLLQKVAAGFLIIVGAVSILQSFGYLGGEYRLVTEEQFSQTVQDMIVAEQLKERERMLGALLMVKEDAQLAQRSSLEQLQEYLVVLEQRYVDTMEENNHYLRTLLTR